MRNYWVSVTNALMFTQIAVFSMIIAERLPPTKAHTLALFAGRDMVAVEVLFCGIDDAAKLSARYC